MRIELAPFAQLKSYMDRIAYRPKVQEAMQVEGLLTVGGSASQGN
jgi:hypothetical protein